MTCYIFPVTITESANFTLDRWRWWESLFKSFRKHFTSWYLFQAAATFTNAALPLSLLQHARWSDTQSGGILGTKDVREMNSDSLSITRGCFQKRENPWNRRQLRPSVLKKVKITTVKIVLLHELLDATVASIGDPDVPTAVEAHTLWIRQVIGCRFRCIHATNHTSKSVRSRSNDAMVVAVHNE